MKNSATRWHVRLLRLGGELVVIVVGVLIALSADGWVELRQERQAEIGHLRALHEDLVTSAELLQESNDGRTRLFASLTRLAEEDLTTAPTDSVSRWIYLGLFTLQNYEPQLSAVADLQNSDQLRLLTSEVRRSIAELNRILQDLERLRADFTASQQRLIDPYLIERLPLAEILAVADSLPLSVRLPTSPNWSGLLTDQLRNAIAFKLSLGKLETARRVQLADQIDLLLGQIDTRMNELGEGAR